MVHIKVTHKRLVVEIFENDLHHQRQKLALEVNSWV